MFKMKVQLNLKCIVLILLTGIIYPACITDKETEVGKDVKTVVTDSKSTNPFPFYKNIEIKLGYHFEVVSWGKGVDTLGGYLILMSDSLKNKYRSIAVEREGVITEAWNMDMDNDGNPEIYIQYVAHKNVTNLQVYEFVGNGFDKINFPGLKESLKKAYKGGDKFFVKNGDLFRSVPLAQPDSVKTTTLVKTLKYSLKGNSFSSQEVKPEQQLL